MSPSRATTPTEGTPLISLHHKGKKPVYLALRSSKGFIVFTVAAAVFTDAFLYGVVCHPLVDASHLESTFRSVTH